MAEDWRLWRSIRKANRRFAVRSSARRRTNEPSGSAAHAESWLRQRGNYQSTKNIIACVILSLHLKWKSMLLTVLPSRKLIMIMQVHCCSLKWVLLFFLFLISYAKKGFATMCNFYRWACWWLTCWEVQLDEYLLEIFRDVSLWVWCCIF